MNASSIKTAVQTVFIIVLTAALSFAGEGKKLPLTYNNLNSFMLSYGPQNQNQLAQPRLAADNTGQKKSPGKAALLSFLLPGLGEYYVGAKGWAMFFVGTEIAALSGWLGNEWYAARLEKEYKVYAVQHAGVNRSGKNVAYWSAIGKYDDIYAYNDQRERDRNFAAMYEESSFYFWQWDSHNNRLTYDTKRLHANAIEANTVYFQLAVVLNHLVSGINALRLARQHNKRLAKSSAWHLKLETPPYHTESGFYGIRLFRTF